MISLIVATIALGILYTTVLTLYRLYFHPLAKFPGPKLAACSLWYEFYYDVLLRGQYIWEIQRLHETYGPIVRVRPDELHIMDSTYLDEIYGTQTRPRNKWAAWTKMSPSTGSVFTTIEHDLHRVRRSALNPFFSKKAVTGLESLIQAKIDQLAERFARACGTGEVIRADVAFTALTTDIIYQYIFAGDDGYLTEEDFKLAWKESIDTGFQAGPIMRQMPWIATVMEALPDSFMAKVNPSIAVHISIKNDIWRRAEKVMASEKKESLYVRKTIFHELRDGDLPPREKEIERVVEEVVVLIGAGSETTAQTLAYTTFHLLANPEKLERLRGELKTVMPKVGDVVSHTVIEQLPYVHAVVSEGLRLSYGVTTRLPRVAPNEALKYGQWVIPPGTAVSATMYFTLMNPDIFPEPEKFSPERWLTEDNPPQFRSSLQRYLVNFGRGTRQCVGINLAYAELYLAVANLFRRFRLENHETTIDDVTCEHDFFVGAPKLGSKGVRIKVIEELSD